MSPRPPMRLADPAWLAALGKAAGAIGSDEFPALLLRLFAGLIRNDMSMVVRYARFSAPDYLVCEGLPRHFIDLYRSSYYRFDPFYSYWQKRERGGVVTIRDVAPPGLERSPYRRVFHRQAHISDELGMFLPGVGRSSISLFLERSKGWFSAREKELARRVFPAIAGLYRAHLARVFAELGSGVGSGNSGLPKRPTLLIDGAGQRVYASEAWRALEARDPQVKAALAELAGDIRKSTSLSDGRVMHVARLDADFPLAPGGLIYAVETAGLSPLQPAARDILARFAPELTPREREIVQLVVEGHPSATIAQRLGISRGTVKNHRRRLYDRLDITTERELFLLYVTWLSRLHTAS
ncbi:MAG TPA: LuxR C-terminal-related transcriptional regulator [Dongiaceae bacterium]